MIEWMQQRMLKILAMSGWWLSIAGVLLPLFLWLGTEPLQERFGSPYQALTSLGSISGIVAVVLFCMNMIYATRLPIFETLFGGLNKVFIAHHLSGGLALCVVLVHPIAFSMRLADQSLRESALLLVPKWSDIPLTMGIIGLWIFIALMVVTFYFSLPYRIWLITHKFLGLAFLFIALHVVLMTNSLDNNLLLKSYVYVLLALAALSFVYRTLLPRIFVKRYQYAVSLVSQVSEGVVKITLQPRGRRIDFKSGQFIFVSFNTQEISKEWHPFTISSNMQDEGLSITVKDLGAYTGKLVKLAPNIIGSSVMVEGAYGRFNFRNFKAKRQIWVAGGIGITPFLSMIKDVTPEYKVDLYYSVKNESEILEWQMMRDLAEKSSGGIRIIPIVTDKVGFLSGSIIQQVSGSFDGAEFLLCGPPPMMRALKGQLKSLGVKKWALHSEEFSMS